MMDITITTRDIIVFCMGSFAADSGERMPTLAEIRAKRCQGPMRNTYGAYLRGVKRRLERPTPTAGQTGRIGE